MNKCFCAYKTGFLRPANITNSSLLLVLFTIQMSMSVKLLHVIIHAVTVWAVIAVLAMLDTS